MTDRPDDGGPAFPVLGNYAYSARGMSLRDYFAAQALPALLELKCHTPIEDVASLAYIAADAMLAERKRRAGS